MKLDNLTDLIELLQDLEGQEPDPNLEDGQVYTPDGEIVIL